jgi:hypothetical protein
MSAFGADATTGSAPMRAFSRSACALEGCGAFGVLIGVAPIVALFLCASASALAEPAAPRNHCAAHGPDYVEVAGGGRCVRIGGHVRGEMAHAAESAPPSLMGAPGGFARAIADGMKGVSETVQSVPAPDSRLYRR